MWIDPIVEEIRQGREEYAKRFNYDLKAIFDDLKEEEKRCGFKVVALPIKRRKPAQSTDDNQIDSGKEANQQQLAQASDCIHNRYAKTFQRLA
ncbi:hypothetical protein BGP_0652 [Beggiatoa sp. PS]|nr:hypothetical protein BGP_0652 [Beggiatoa sp. PS]